MASSALPYTRRNSRRQQQKNSDLTMINEKNLQFLIAINRRAFNHRLWFMRI